jgi:hypothetical protein
VITFTVRPDDGEPYELVADSRDLLGWEKQSKGRKTFMGLMETLNLIDMYQVAHIAAKRQGRFAGELAEFERTCVLEFDAEEEPDPTQRDRSKDG